MIYYSESRDLHLHRAVLEDGKVVAGSVINGGWWWKYGPEGQEYAMHSEQSVTPVSTRAALPDDWQETKDTQ